MSDRFVVVDTIVSAGFGAVRNHSHILDTEKDGKEEYRSHEFNQQQYDYVRKTVKGRFVKGLEFHDSEHAQCMAAALNLGHNALGGRLAEARAREAVDQPLIKEVK